MALGGFPIPPWLQTRPAEHAQASESGLSAGLQAAHIWAQAAAERQRLAEAAKRSDLEAALESERLQQKSVYDAQKLAADVAYNKASLSQSEARIKQTQDNAARMAKQWEMQQQANRLRLQQSAGQAAAALAQKTAHENVLERQAQQRIDKPSGGSRLAPEAQVDDDLLKQKISQANSQIKATSELLAGNPRNDKFKKAMDALVSQRDDLVLQRKKLRGYTGFTPVMGKKQAGESERFTVAPVDEESDQPDKEDDAE